MAFINISLADVLFALVVCSALLYLYSAYVYNYWKKRDVYYVKPTLILGNLKSVVLQQEHLGQYMRRLYLKNPDRPLIGMFALWKPMLLVRDLDLIRSILVKDAHAFLDRGFAPPDGVDVLFGKTLFMLKGKKWRHMRIKLTPTFTSGKIKKMFILIDECGKQLVPTIEQEISKGSSVVVKDMMARYSTDVIASCAFGLNANALQNPDCEFRTIMRKTFEPSGLQKISGIVEAFMPWLCKFFKFNIIDESVNDFVRKTFWDVVEHRRKNGLVRKDFVDLLMQIRDDGEVRADDAKDMEEIKHDSKYMNVDFSKSDRSDIQLDDDDIVAQAFVFIAAGFETSSSVITFTLFELALNPAIQDRLRREINNVLEKHGGKVTYDAIAEMNYLEMVVSEALRKYPTLPMLDRKCLSDYTVEGTDITIEKDVAIAIPVMGIHYDPEVYPDPHKYDPERFNAKNKSERPHFAYLPFGEGPRICIGMRFGQMQVKTALIHILTSFLVRPCEDTPEVPLDFQPFGGVLIPRKNIVLSFTKIK